MSDKKSEQEWLGKIRKGLDWRRQNSREDAWERITAYYEHKFVRPLDPHFNLIYMMASSWIPTLIFQSPGIINTARRPEFIYWSQFFDGIDNWLVDEMEVQGVFEDAILFAFLHNTVGVELGYDDPGITTVPEGDMQFGSVEGSIDRSRKWNQPWLDVIPPDKLILAPGTRTMKNCLWYAKEVWVRTEVLKGMKTLKNVTATHNLPKKDENIGAQGYTKLYIIHDADKKEWMWLNSNGDFVLFPEEDPMQMDGLPLEVITFNRGLQNIWGTPDAMYIESQQIEGDECRKDGRLQRRQAIVKGFYNTESISEEKMKAFLTGDPVAMIPLELGANTKLSDVLAFIQGHVQLELFEAQRELLNDAQLIAGTGPNQLGTFAPGRRSAREAGIVEDRNFLRTGSRRNKVAQAIGKLFGQVNQIITKRWKAPLVRQVVGLDAVMYWVRGRPDEFKELAAQLTTKVNVESMTPVSREKRKSDMIALLQILSKVQGVNILPLIQQFLTQFDWTEGSKLLPTAPQTSPMGMTEFQGQQQMMARNPQLGTMAQGNLNRLMPMANSLPTGGSNNE